MKTCVLIQTCDKYEHLWEGLKLSYQLNWCWDIGLPIYILTEDKVFPYDRFKTLNFGYFGQEEKPIKNFSTRMIAALNHLKSLGFDSILYTQDDFWPLFKVEKKVFEETLNFLSKDDVDCVHINEYLPWYNYNLSKTNHYINGIRIKKFEVPSAFYYNHQAAFWKIDSLLRIQNSDEEPYENECKGTERSWKIKPNYYFLNYSWYKAEFINNKGSLLPVAESFVRDWNFNLKYNLNNNMNNRLDNIVKFDFTHPDNKDFEGCLKVTVSPDAGKYLSENEFPLRFQVYAKNNYIAWNTDLYPGYWSSYSFITYCKADIITATGVKLLEWNWNTFEHGDFCHQAFYLWAMKNRGCRGIAIGTHDGTSGEWVGPVMDGLLPAVLVEPSDRQHYLLERLYANKTWITIDKACVTPNGGEVRFYEAGLGHTNSVNPEHVSKYLPNLPISEKVFQSLTLRQMIDKHGIGNGTWWMHLDVEDLDDKLIISFDYNGINLPECIIFENENLPEERLSLVSDWLQSHNYECTSSGRNTICFLKK